MFKFSVKYDQNDNKTETSKILIDAAEAKIQRVSREKKHMTEKLRI